MTRTTILFYNYCGSRGSIPGKCHFGEPQSGAAEFSRHRIMKQVSHITQGKVTAARSERWLGRHPETVELLCSLWTLPLSGDIQNRAEKTSMVLVVVGPKSTIWAHASRDSIQSTAPH